MDFLKIILKIEGELVKYNTLPVEVLIRLSQNLQNIISSIANYDLPAEETIDLNNFKLDLSGFITHKSVIPEFSFTERIQNITFGSVQNQRNEVLKQFDALMKIANSGDYDKLLDHYPDPLRRNIFINTLFGFANCTGTSPLYVLDQDYQKKFVIQRFKPEVKNRLLSPIVEAESLIPEKHIQLAQVQVTKGKKREKVDVIKLFNEKYKSVDFSPEVIVHKDIVYELRSPLRCRVDYENDYIIIDNDLLGIFAFGSNDDEAEAMFSEQFDLIYRRYNELPDEKLTEDVIRIKGFLNNIIKSISS